MAKIKLSDLRDALEMQMDDSITLFNLKTGETTMTSNDPFSPLYDEDEAEDIEENEDDYIAMPSKFEINEYGIMEDFIYSLKEGRIQDRLFSAIHGRGAFRRFREVLDQYDMEEKWYHYRDAALERIGRGWAGENDIEVIEDVPSYLHEEEEEDAVKKILIVVDMQNDFIDGSLGTKEAQAIVPAVIEKIKSYPKENVYATRDTHPIDYLDTQEGQNLPVPHCIEGTKGWQIQKDIWKLIDHGHVYNKPTFGSLTLANKMESLNEENDIEIELVGLCTDICVVSNALLLKAYLPEVKISVDSACCAGVTPEKHEAALETMRSCQIHIL